MYHGGESEKKRNPRETANFLSLITFFFTYDLLKKGFRKDVEENDIYEVIPNFKSSKLGDRLEKQWLIEQSRGNPSIFRLLWSCYGKFYLFWGVVQLVLKVTWVLVQPRALGKLVSYFTSSSKVTKEEAIFYAVLVIGLNIIYCTYAHNYMLVITELGIRARTALCSLIYRKSLKLSSSSLSQISIGKIVTLISKDVNSLDSAIIFMNDMWISLILLALTSYLIYARIGIATLAGISFLIIIIPLQVYVGNLTSKLRIRASKITDQRMQATQETLSAIKVIKMYTWEKVFSDKISKIREEEVKRIQQIFMAKALSLVIGSLVINITLYIIVMVYTSLGNVFTAELAFFLMSCLQSLRSSVTISIPIGIAQSAELVAAARRIREVLTAKEQSETERHKSFKPSIELDKVTVQINGTVIIEDINLRIDSGFHLITGRLGGGKSSLLKTILEDYPICQGLLKVQGTISYASEQPWLFPSSIKQNILFGQNYDEERYRKVLYICALKMDIDTFENGDDTIVDDGGMNLSKGQQARISLARAVYKDSDIYLLDDCLSSLDTHVQEFVFRECIRSYLKDKIVIMISHNERQLKEADNVIIMENGTIKSCMKPAEIPEDEIHELIREEEEIEDGDIIDNIEMETEEKNQEEDTSTLMPKIQRNIYHEEKKEGGVNYKVYRKYFQYGGKIFILLFILFPTAQIGTTFSDKLVSSWVNIQQNISEYKTNQTNTTEFEELLAKNEKLLLIYTITIMASTVLVLARAYVHFSFCSRASNGLHKSMISAIVNATMHFFDLRYLGNILNRFSKDLGAIDEYLPLITYECLRLIFTLTGIIVLIATVNKFFLVPAIIVFCLLYFIRKCYLPTGRSLKRLDSASTYYIIRFDNF